MIRTYLLMASTLLLAGGLGSTVFAQVTAEDFLPIVDGGSSQVAAPGKVSVTKDSVTAATAQDAINAAVNLNEEELQKSDSFEVGCKAVSFPSGLGFVATGIGTYDDFENVVASRKSKRSAYVRAFEEAKKNLAEHLGGLSNSGRTKVMESLSQANLPDKNLVNTTSETLETTDQAIDMLLKGFIIFKVYDNTQSKSIYVSIVTTPKTRGKFARLAPSVLEASDLHDALNQVITEVRSGLVPPIGGKIVLVKNTEETAFIGFGSSVVGVHDNPGIQAKLKLDSQKISKARSTDALCGIIIGDRISWNLSTSEQQIQSLSEFEDFKDLAEQDPLKRISSSGVKQLDRAFERFASISRTLDVFNSARNGVLPPGVTTKTWFDADNAWAYSMSVYIPSQTNAAASVAKEMSESNIVQGIGSPGGPPSAKGSPNKAAPGPSGTVTKPGDL